MINSVLDSIVQSIYSEFGEGYDIYTETVKQGLKEPCFFISCISHKTEKFLDFRYYVEDLFAIQYFPHSDDKSNECYDVIERIYKCLEYIKVDGDLVMAKNLECNVVDEMISVTVNYNAYVYRKWQEINMETLEIESRR